MSPSHPSAHKQTKPEPVLEVKQVAPFRQGSSAHEIARKEQYKKWLWWHENDMVA